MTPDQQRNIDENIIAGRLIDAIGLYRAATGCSTAEAERLVRQQSAAFSGHPQPVAQSRVPNTATYAATQQADAVATTVKRTVIPVFLFSGIIALVPIVIVVFVLFGAFRQLDGAFGGSRAGSLGTIGMAFKNPGGLAGTMFVQQPYYSSVASDVKGDPNFRRALGSPIEIDQGGITCLTVRSSYIQRSANCNVPVQGPKGSGTVNVVVVDQPGSFGLVGQLTTGGRKIPMAPISATLTQ